MIYPLLRPVQPVFNSAAAIRNTLTLGFDGDVKEAWKPLSVQRPRCLHTHSHPHVYTHSHACTTTQILTHRRTVRRTHRDFYQKRLILPLLFFSSLFSQTAVHCFFLDTQKKKNSYMITHLRSPGSRLCFQHFLN